MVDPLIHLPSGNLKCVFLANMSTTNRADAMMNNGVPVNIEIGFLTKNRKNTIPGRYGNWDIFSINVRTREIQQPDKNKGQHVSRHRQWQHQRPVEKWSSRKFTHGCQPCRPNADKKGSHEWMIEFENPPKDIDYFTDVLDKALWRKLGQLSVSFQIIQTNLVSIITIWNLKLNWKQLCS